MKAGLIGCGIVALLLVLVFVGGLLYVRKNPSALMDLALAGIERNYGPDVTEEDKRELKAAVEDFKEAIRSNRLHEDSSRGLQRSFSVKTSSMRNSSRKLTHEDVQELIRMFRDAAGKPGSPSEAPTMVPMVATPSR
jgi:hypothetical protein